MGKDSDKDGTDKMIRKDREKMGQESDKDGKGKRQGWEK